MKKRNTKILLFVFMSLLVTELLCRYYGLHQFPLFIESNDYEYIHKANQDTYIYRHHFITNEYSMRSMPIQENDTLVVLLIGDSILNGTNQVGHDNLASTILEDTLKKRFKTNIRVLNISSYSWGPDNTLSYINKYGSFNADLIVLVFNSWDAYDNMTFEKVVGINQVYTKENYQIATFKLIQKTYNIVINKLIEAKSKGEQKKQIEKKFCNGFEGLDDVAHKYNVPLLVYLHPDIIEVKAKKYSEDGKLIIDFYEKRNRKVILGLSHNCKESYYLDKIHYNKQGQKFMADVLFPEITQLIKLK